MLLLNLYVAVGLGLASFSLAMTEINLGSISRALLVAALWPVFIAASLLNLFEPTSRP